jgi:uncharacterized protein YbjT (DUF2867 family)
VAPTDILITGATGFVGSHLLARLREDERLNVRVLVRDAARIEDPEGIEVLEGDLADPELVAKALAGVSCAYYLVHSMEAGSGGFSGRDRKLAEGFVRACDTAGVARVVYLGGIQPDGDTSEHLDSRLEVERILAGGEAAFVALRASMIIGADSASFRTLAQIVDRLPVLALPSWRSRSTQPVAIDDVTAALDSARAVAPGHYDIAGPDRLTFEEMTKRIATLLGQSHRSVPLPFSSTRLEGAAAALVTDADRELLEPVMAGLHDNLVIEDNALQRVFGVTPTAFDVAAADALGAIAQAAA